MTNRQRGVRFTERPATAGPDLLKRVQNIFKSRQPKKSGQSTRRQAGKRFTESVDITESEIRNKDMCDAIDAAHGCYGYGKATPEQLSKIKDMAVNGKPSVNKLIDSVGISSGLAHHLHSAMKEVRASYGSSKPLSSSERINRHLKDNRIRLR